MNHLVVELWHITGWTMVHFLWLGAVVGAGGLLARLVLRRASANVRYTAALCCFLLLAALPVGVAAWLCVHAESLPIMADRSATSVESAPIMMLQEPITVADISPLRLSSPRSPLPVSSPQPLAPSPLASAAATLETCVHYLPWLWIVGTPITFALLAAGLVGTKRLRRESRQIDDDPVRDLMLKLASSLRVTRRVTLAVCDRIAAPVVIGIVRPMILLPPAALTGWSPDEIEMVLLHELAHVRRWDNLVNLMQRVIESLLFFHPAVWLVSAWIRREREACCDAAVVSRTHRPHAYAELLVALAAQMPRSVLFHPAASSAMAAGPLRGRIRRILKLEDDPMLITGKSLTFVFATLLTAATLAVLYVPRIGQAEQSATKDTKGTKEAELAIDLTTEKESAGEKAPFEYTEDRQLPAAEVAQNVEDQTNELGDVKKLERLFLSDENSHVETRIYKLPAAFEVIFPEVPDLTERLQKAPPNRKFVYKLTNSGTLLEVRAPEAAQKQYFARRIKEREKNTSQDEQVIATFALNEFPQEEVAKLAAEIQRKGRIPDLIVRDNHQVVVSKRPPTEADWPAILGEPPRKERVIAEKAWQRLGLKLVPTTILEQRLGLQTGIRIVGGNVPKGLPLPVCLTNVASYQINDMNDLLKWLDSELGNTGGHVRCYAMADWNEYLFECAPAGSESAPDKPTGKQESPSAPQVSAELDAYRVQRDSKLAIAAQEAVQGAAEHLAESATQKQAALAKRQAAKEHDEIEAAKRELEEADRQFEEAKRNLENAVRQLEKYQGPDAQPPKKTSLVPNAELLATEQAIQAARKSVAESAKRKQEALDKRLETASADDHGVAEATKRELEDANRQLEEAKRALEKAGRKATPKPDSEFRPASPQPAPNPYIPRVNIAPPAPTVPEVARPVAAPPSATIAPQARPSPAPTVPPPQSPAAQAVPAKPAPILSNPNPFFQPDVDIELRPATEGVVLGMVKSPNEDLVEVNLGSRKGVKPGSTLEVVHDDQPVERLTIVAVSPDKAVGHVEDAYHKVQVEKGDRVFVHHDVVQLKSEVRKSVPAGGDKPFDDWRTAWQADLSVGVLKKIVERERQEYERIQTLAKAAAAPASQVEAKKTEYEISVERLRQAERALESRRLAIELAKADYEQAVDANEKSAGAISTTELRRLKLLLDFAEARYKELAEDVPAPRSTQSPLDAPREPSSPVASPPAEP